jgi:hypothetical protein
MDGVERNITCRDLRRAYATQMDDSVENPDTLLQAMCHNLSREDDRVTRGYVSRPRQDDIRRSLASLPVVELVETLSALCLASQEK